MLDQILIKNIFRINITTVWLNSKNRLIRNFFSMGFNFTENFFLWISTIEPTIFFYQGSIYIPNLKKTPSTFQFFLVLQYQVLDSFIVNYRLLSIKGSVLFVTILSVYIYRKFATNNDKNEILFFVPPKIVCAHPKIKTIIILWNQLSLKTIIQDKRI